MLYIGQTTNHKSNLSYCSFLQKGYTFVAEAFTGDNYVSASRWKLRLIGPYTPLPCLARDAPCNTFATKEIRDYYIPNDKKILFRYMTKGEVHSLKNICIGG